MTERVPFTILTGYLGAGKTTTLNRVLSAKVGGRVAVVINDLGRVSIDRSLIQARDGDLMELAGGCVCCQLSLQRDLWDGILEIAERIDPEHIVLETTGIAEPQILLAQLNQGGAERERIAGAGVVCVFDAQVGAATAADHPEPRAQIECADRVLMTKLDLATPSELAAAHRTLEEINADAEVAAFPREPGVDRELAAWLLAARVPRPTGAAAGRAHRHGQLEVTTFADSAPLLEQPLRALLDAFGPSLVRAKGFVHVAGAERRFFLERAGALTRLEPGAPWGDEPRRTELVFIGDRINPASIERQLRACQVQRGKVTAS